METGAASFRRGRLMHAVFSLTVVLYIYLSEVMATPDAKSSASFVATMSVFACVIAVVAYQIRRKKLQPALDKLRQDPNDPEALKSWRLGTILPSILAESIALFGLVFRIVGAGRGVSWLFFVASLILLAMWRPQMNLNTWNTA